MIQMPWRKKMQVQELMSRPAFTCGRNDTMSTAAGLMWERDCGAIPVTDDEGRVAGIITDRDICMAAYTAGKPLSDMNVAQAMSRELFACHVSDSIEDVEQIMSTQQIRRMPVVDDEDRPVGMISLNDIARHTDTKKESREVQREVLHTLASISRPRARA